MPYPKNRKNISRDLPALVYANERGEIFDHPYLKMGGMSGNNKVIPDKDEIIPLPFGSTLFSMPGRSPVGWDPVKKRFSVYDANYHALAAFLPPGFVRTLLPCTALNRGAPTLPLWAYTAVGWKDGKFWATGIMVDQNPHWDPKYFQDDAGLTRIVKDALKKSPQNRLLHHLADCALKYHCFAAKNCFYQRWELPLPTSPICNAKCMGCISFQPPSSCKAPHARIKFVPTVQEICEIALPHLEKAEDPIASFGQGCEGEPILQAKTIQASVKHLRSKTAKGIINLNTNGSIPGAISDICGAGLDTIRVTINSPDEGLFNVYHNPINYTLKEVKKSLILAKEKGCSTAINLLVFPGVTDREEERDRIIKFIGETGTDQIQMRNLNIDPDQYLNVINPNGNRYSLRKWMSDIKEVFPFILFSYFNRSK